MTKYTYQKVQNCLSLLTFFILGTSFYLQYMRGLQPCPLCLMQRFCLILLLLSCVIGVCSSTLRLSRVITVFQILFSIAGLFFAGRQLWLQSLPVGQAPACIPDFNVLIRYFPWKDILHALLWGAGDCAEVTWKLLGLSIAAWSALYFLFILIVSTIVLLGLNKSIKQ